MSESPIAAAVLRDQLASARARIAELESGQAESLRREAVQDALYRIAETASAGLDLRAFYATIHEIVGGLMFGENFYIALYDDERQMINFPYYADAVDADVPDPTEWEPFGIGNASGATAYLLRIGRPMHLPDARMKELVAAGELSFIGEAGVDWLGVPLISDGRTLGALIVQTYRPGELYTDEDVEVLTFVGRHVAQALARARAIDETRRLNAELGVINRVGRALAAQLDLDALIDLVGEQMGEVFEADIVYVALHDPATNLIEFPYYNERGLREAQTPLAFGEGLTSRILTARTPVLLNKAAQFDEIGTRGIGTLARSYLGVPILAGDDAIGVISVQSSTEDGRFGEADAALLSTLAANVGVAIQNARMLRARQDAERQYRRLVEELPLAMYIDPPDTLSGTRYVSPSIEALFGHPPTAWYEDSFFERILHADDRDLVLADHARAFDAGMERWAFEYRIIALDGRTVWVRDEAVVVKDDQGSPQYVQGFLIDITDQTLAAAELRRQKSYFESLVEISPVAVVTMDREEIVSGWNPAATRLFGYEPGEAIGHAIDDLIVLPDEREEAGAMTHRAAATGRVQLIGRRRRRDGEPVEVEIVVVPLVIDGEHTGYYAIYHDITELQAARREADAANAAKGTFLAAMSHEIRTPMNAIIGMSGLLVGTPLDEEQRDYAETIRTSGESLLTIINDILDFSKIEAGRIELEAVPFALGPCIEGALDVVAPGAGAKKVELAYSIDPDLPHVVIGDPGRLRQIVLNLLSNAVKFTERGEVVVSVGGRRLGDPGLPARWEIAVEVHDTGIGIPPDRMGRLFQSFSQADASISRRYGGTGLGLVISQRLAELMEGSLTASSSGVPGEGSTFRLALRATEAPESSVPEPAPVPSTELTGRRVLIVDDSATNRRILVALLRRWEMSPRETASPHEALEWIRAGELFDLALIDGAMPEMDGLELAAAIRQATAASPLPVVLVSSLGNRVRDGAPVAATLTKPVKPSPLLDTIQTILAGSVATPAGPQPVADHDLPGVRHPLRILLAEDNAVNQKLAIRLLRQMGYAADVAGNGLEAIAALELASYDLVLMDIQMPELDGLEATRRIRTRWSRDGGPRIIAMTANAMAGDRELCLAAGMDDYVSKPIRVEALAAALAVTPILPGRPAPDLDDEDDA